MWDTAKVMSALKAVSHEMQAPNPSRFPVAWLWNLRSSPYERNGLGGHVGQGPAQPHVRQVKGRSARGEHGQGPAQPLLSQPRRDQDSSSG